MFKWFKNLFRKECLDPYAGCPIPYPPYKAPPYEYSKLKFPQIPYDKESMVKTMREGYIKEEHEALRKMIMSLGSIMISPRKNEYETVLNILSKWQDRLNEVKQNE